MTYSPDLRSRVLAFVKQGGSKVEASARFGVHRLTIYSWLRQPLRRPKLRRTRQRKLDKLALQQHVQTYPDAVLRERADHFGVHPNAIWVALRHLDISVKKNAAVSRKKPGKKNRIPPKTSHHHS